MGVFMALFTNILIGFIAVLHFYFLVLEMFFWDKPKGLKVFGHTLESARASKVLAMNQGLYNGFLSAGLIWGLSLGVAGVSIQVFFLACVAIAGIFGALTVSRKILFIQAMPAIIALIIVIFA
jgi:putative membrane protein